MLKLDRNNPNAFIGIILLVVLLVFVLPDRLPGSIADQSPQLFAGIPCARLPASKDLAAHQSILGRQAQDPLRLKLTAGDINDEGGFLMRLSVANVSLGTIPIVFQEDNLVIAEADDDTDGFGIIIQPAPAEGLRERTDPNPVSYAESDIRLLGPRQTCVHSVELVASAAMNSDGGTASAWYRMRAAGEQQPQSEGVRLIFPDQGLDILAEGVVFSDEIEIAPRA